MTNPADPKSEAPDAVQFHDAIAHGWDVRYLRGSFARRAAAITSQALPSIPSAGKWLDVGCGSGFFSRRLAALGHSVIGIDASPAMIAAANHAAHEAGAADLQFQVSGAQKIQFEAQHFDGCLCLSVLEYVDDPAKCVSEIARVTAPGGMLILTAPNRLSPMRAMQQFVTLFRKDAPKRWSYVSLSRNAFTRGSIRKLLLLEGFIVQKFSGFDPIAPRFLHAVWPPSLILVIAKRVSAHEPASDAPPIARQG
ncbi:MAG: class I SAM-dependent methyltransferase [Beijerinckiaceae bacterium]|nr:class I SAM-dependent methyltransferase [Beijerinckiaceae bacterium]